MLNNLKTPPLPRGPKMWSNVEKRGGSVLNVGDSLASLKEAFQTFMNGVSNIENPLDGGIR